MAVNLKQVAERAGLSIRTVSYVLNGRGAHLFRAETADRVRRAARELGYRPNRSAQAIRAGRFHCAGLVLSTAAGRSTLPDGLLAGIHEALAETDRHLAVSRLPDEKLTDRQFVPDILRTWMVDGLLINYTDHIPGKLVAMLEDHAVPSVWINTKRPSDCVHPDDFAACRAAARQLIELGHRRIAYLDYSHGHATREPHYSAVDRKAGCERALADAGLTAQIEWAADTVPTDRTLARATALLSGPQRSTAVVAYARKMAETCLVAALRAGLRVPEDLSLTCFDERGGGHLGVSIATRIVPDRAVGIEAVRMLGRKVAEPDQRLPAIAVPFGFDAGTSCAPPSGERAR